MKYNDLMTSIRHWDNLVAKWFLKHFYFVFFQIILVIAFIIWFINIFNVIDINIDQSSPQVLQKALKTQSVNTALIVFLLLLNSFWSLFIFNSVYRITTLLRDMNFHLSKMRYKNQN